MGGRLFDAGGVLVGARRRWTNRISFELVEYARDTPVRGIPRCAELFTWLHLDTGDTRHRGALRALFDGDPGVVMFITAASSL